ncbi:hypothetical protein UFOVP1366_31 [uncultured Caudovirales phage]|uniref:Uncharacterized protein n=1 Tax=uncultured Caudovirales phage TaxID=2100421 RepID=A0A6J5RVV1_9CAUD|nr:hypothetical protein UFOVP1366_31 [uncultured Caudovirales phage]
MPPFVVFALPRSRTAWLSRFLTYGDWMCGHEELRHTRSLDDVTAWFSQPNIGASETAAASWWRLLDRFAPGARVLIVRRPVSEVVNSMINIPGLSFDRAALERAMSKLDRKLDQIEARCANVLSVKFNDLNDETVCAAAFEHCLPHTHDHEHWARLAPMNIQIDMPALTRYVQAYLPALNKVAAIAKHQTLAAMATRKPMEPEGITFQTETFDDWLDGGAKLFDDHLVAVGETPGNWQNKNIGLMQRLYEVGAMQIMTARCNGRMFGYLMTLVAPSLASEDWTTATHTTFYADPEFPGLGLKLQRAALRALKERGVDEVFLEAGQRGSGPRLSMLYKRLGALDYSHVYRMQLTEH